MLIKSNFYHPLFTVLMFSLSYLPTTTAHADNNYISQSGSYETFKGSAEHFTGDATIEILFNETSQSHFSGALVTFQPGAHSAWHTHPLGQRLIVTSGKGLTQLEGGPIIEIYPGDVVWCPPGIKHWHGASQNSMMSHIALNESINGKNVEWLEKVSPQEYNQNFKEKQQTNLKIQQPNVEDRRLSPTDVEMVAPALEHYTQDRLYGDVWNRPGLSRRDRSIVTIATMITRGQFGALNYYFDQAIKNGVKPSELSEIIVHLAYYSGWGNAFGAIRPAKEVFVRHGITTEQLPPAFETLMPLDEKTEAQRESSVNSRFGSTAPGVVKYTTDALFRDLWLRPGLTPRDRSLATVSTLIALGQDGPVGYHLNRAMDNGLSQEEASEVLTQLAFYAGWPNVFHVLPVFKEVFDSRNN